MNRKIGLYLACVGIFSVSLCLSAAAQNGTSVAFLKNNSEVFTVSDGEFNAEITFASPVPSETHSVLISYDGARITDISYEFLPSGAETFTTKKVSVSKRLRRSVRCADAVGQGAFSRMRKTDAFGQEP